MPWIVYFVNKKGNEHLSGYMERFIFRWWSIDINPFDHISYLPYHILYIVKYGSHTFFSFISLMIIFIVEFWSFEVFLF